MMESEILSNASRDRATTMPRWAGISRDGMDDREGCRWWSLFAMSRCTLEDEFLGGYAKSQKVINMFMNTVSGCEEKRFMIRVHDDFFK